MTTNVCALLTLLFCLSRLLFNTASKSPFYRRIKRVYHYHQATHKYTRQGYSGFYSYQFFIEISKHNDRPLLLSVFVGMLTTMYASQAPTRMNLTTLKRMNSEPSDESILQG